MVIVLDVVDPICEVVEGNIEEEGLVVIVADKIVLEEGEERERKEVETEVD